MESIFDAALPEKERVDWGTAVLMIALNATAASRAGVAVTPPKKCWIRAKPCGAEQTRVVYRKRVPSTGNAGDETEDCKRMQEREDVQE